MKDIKDILNENKSEDIKALGKSFALKHSKDILKTLVDFCDGMLEIIKDDNDYNTIMKFRNEIF